MSLDKSFSAYILCGGKSFRMKTDKGLMLYESKTFVEHIINALKSITSTIILVAKNDQYKQFGCEVICDVYENSGPVGGIYTALNHSKTEKNLIVSCDVPKITSHLFEDYLIPNSESSDVTFLSDGMDNYPLIGIYSKSTVSEFEMAIKNNHLKLLKLIETLNHKSVVVDEHDKAKLLNINTVEDLKKL